ncbi:MAG: thioredoxin [Candidatus Bathyarchaeia archaeon]
MVDATLTVTDVSFDKVVQGAEAVVVDCWAPWCAPCRMLAPVLEELAQAYAGKVTFAKLNTDENPLTAERFGIMSIPTLLFFKGGKLVDTVVGVVPRAYLEAKVKKLL